MPAVNYLWNSLSDNIDQEYDDNGNVLAEYTHEPVLHGRLISEHRNGHTYYHHCDAQGDTIAVTDENGNVTDTFAYTANGEVTERTGTTETPFQFGGEHGYYTDLETGEISVRRRDYDPPMGRWLSIDPIGMLADINLYRCVRNNPVSLIDPSGLQAKDQSGFYQEIELAPQIAGYCGGAEGQVFWRFKDQKKGLKGWVIQHAIWRWDVYNCDGSPRQVKAFDYFEAWQVVDGIAYQSFTNKEAMPPWADSFDIGDRGDRTKGKISITGCAMFLKDYDLKRPPWLNPDDDEYPKSPSPAPIPVLLPPNMPEGFKATDSLCRTLISRWNCCTCPITPTDISESTGWD